MASNPIPLRTVPPSTRPRLRLMIVYAAKSQRGISALWKKRRRYRIARAARKKRSGWDVKEEETRRVAFLFATGTRGGMSWTKEGHSRAGPDEDEDENRPGFARMQEQQNSTFYQMEYGQTMRQEREHRAHDDEAFGLLSETDRAFIDENLGSTAPSWRKPTTSHRIHLTVLYLLLALLAILAITPRVPHIARVATSWGLAEGPDLDLPQATTDVTTAGKRYAYAQYVTNRCVLLSSDSSDSHTEARWPAPTNRTYLCNAIIMFKRLRRFGAKAEFALTYPTGWEKHTMVRAS